MTKPAAPIRAAIYARYSSTMQADGYSIDAQVTACRELCAARGFIVLHEYIDEARSAATTKRPEFRRMLADARAKLFDVLIVHKLDRFGRNLADIVTLWDDLRALGVTFVSVAEAFDFTTPHGQIMLAVLGGLAQWYRSNLQAETTKGKASKARAGGHNGPPPFGYTRVPDETRPAKPGKPQPTRIVPGDDAEHVRAAFEAYAAGTLTDGEIAAMLNERGAVTSGNWGRRPFSKDTVTAILRNRFYAGFVAYRGLGDETTPDRRRKRRAKGETVWYAGQHEPLISEALFERCQRVRARRTNRYRGIHAATGGRCYLLQRIGTCAKCGQPLRATHWTRGAAGYRCTSKERGLPCSCVRRAVSQAALEPQLAEIVRGLTLTDEQKADALALIAGDDLVRAYEAERRKLEAALKRAGKVHMMGVTSEAEFEGEVRRIRAALAELTAPAAAVDLQRALTALGDTAALWAEATPDERAEFLRTIFESIAVDTDTRQIVGGVPRKEYAALVGAASDGYGSDGHRLPI